MCAKEKPGKKNDVRSFSSSSNFLNVVVMMRMMIEGIFKKDVSKKTFRKYPLYIFIVFVFVFVFCICICVSKKCNCKIWPVASPLESGAKS